MHPQFLLAVPFIHQIEKDRVVVSVSEHELSVDSTILHMEELAGRLEEIGA